MSEVTTEANEQPALVQTGLVAAAQTQAAAPAPAAATPPAATVEAAPVASDPGPAAEPVKPVDPPVSNSSEPIKIIEIFAPRPMLSAQQRNDEIMAEIMRTRAQNEPVNKPTQPVAPRITEQTLREMQAGAVQSAKHAEARANQAPRVISQAEAQSQGSTSTVYRPNAVPGMNSKNDQARGVRTIG